MRDLRHALGEQRNIAAHAVDDEAGDELRIFGVEHRLGADQARDHPAAIDVADHHHRHVGRAGEAHIGDVVLAQIDLRRAARAFDQDDVCLLLQFGETLKHVRHQLRLQTLHLPRRCPPEHLALDDHLRAHLALGFQQHRVHMHRWFDIGRQSLQRLGAADLAAFRRHGGVVRHVLRLERPDAESALHQRASEPGDQQRLADARPRALQHEDAGGHQYSMPACAFTPSAK